MTDCEKVLIGLEHCSRGVIGCNDCIYRRDFGCRAQLAADALELLKEQEPVKPDIDSEGTCTCGNCGEKVGYYPVGCNTPEKLGKFCPECGRKVKWDD